MLTVLIHGMAASMAPRTDGIVNRGRLITLNVVLVDCLQCW